jgi:hypothetical protein
MHIYNRPTSKKNTYRLMIYSVQNMVLENLGTAWGDVGIVGLM